MTAADSPENKCPACGTPTPMNGFWCDQCSRFFDPSDFGGSGRVNTSGGEAGSREARNESRSSTTSGLIHTSPSVDPQCPDCGGMGSDEGGFRGGKKWKAICPSCGGSGRSPVDSGTGTDEKDARPPIDVYAELEGGNWEKWYSAYCDLWELFVNRDAEAVQAESEVELLRASVPSSPHETGLTAEQKARIEGIVDGVLEGMDSASAPSAAPTNPEPSRSDSEGEEAAFERGRESRQGEIDALETEIKSLHARLKKRYGKKVR